MSTLYLDRKDLQLRLDAKRRQRPCQVVQAIRGLVASAILQAEHLLAARRVQKTMPPHAILDDEVFQVPDALDDPRFADNPLVSEDPRVRFYAGVPLTLADGSRAGTLCVLDYRPRVLDADQLAELRRLGALVTEELEAGW